MHETGEAPPELIELNEQARRGWDETPPAGVDEPQT
jgi:hypothetical protein